LVLKNITDLPRLISMIGVGAYLREDAMLRYFIILMNTFIISLILFACAPDYYRPKNVKVNEENNGDIVYLNIGDKLEVVLEGNPTTGYQWIMFSDVSPYLRQMGEPVYEPTGEEIGSGGKTTFALEAIGSGQTRLKVVYSQPFDKETPPIKTFELTVIIER
jgi:inhibitor of cysteine peptidase